MIRKFPVKICEFQMWGLDAKGDFLVKIDLNMHLSLQEACDLVKLFRMEREGIAIASLEFEIKGGTEE